jgi:prepilin-type N-terminal cleavage/methylation domain-containing protein
MRIANARRGYSIVEVLVAMTILLVGVAGTLAFFAPTLQAAEEANHRSIAAMLAQQRVEEVRRDADRFENFPDAIRGLVTPSDLVVYPYDDRFAWQYCGRSLLQPIDTIANSDDDWFVPRVIVRCNPAYRPDAKILLELRFEVSPP